jgi:pYEATS domain-containing protein involved in immunity
MMLRCRVASVVTAVSLAVAMLRSQAGAQAPGQGLNVAVGNTAYQTGLNTWAWTIFVMGDEQALNQVKCVTYLLHPTFTQRLQRICTRGKLSEKGFLLKTSGWGTFDVGVTVEYQDSRKAELTHRISFDPGAQGWSLFNPSGRKSSLRIPVTAAAPKDGNFIFTLNYTAVPNGPVEVTSLGIGVLEDGSVGKTRWRFDVFMNDDPWIRLESRSYNNDQRKAVEFKGPSLVVIADPVLQDGDRTNSVRIVGYR